VFTAKTLPWKKRLARGRLVASGGPGPEVITVSANDALISAVSTHQISIEETRPAAAKTSRWHERWGLILVHICYTMYT